MRYVLTILCLIALSFAGSASAAGDIPESRSAESLSQEAGENARQAREILDKTIAALGGEAYLNWQDVVQRGRTHGFQHGAPAGVGIPFERMVRFPDRERLAFFESGEWVLLYAGEQGWETTFRGTRQQEAQELADYLRRRGHSLEHVLRVWLKEPGTALFYDGAGMVDAKQVHRVTVMNARNEAATIFIDQSSSLPVRKSYMYRDPKSRERFEETEIYEMYRPVQGIMTPHNISRLRDGEMVNQRFIREVRYNSGVAETAFAAPKVNWDPKKRTPPVQQPPPR